MEERLERIRAMEERLNRLLQWQGELERLLERLPLVREDEAALAAYLESAEWREDLESDEAGLLPAGLPRGVLSEDGLFNALESQRELEDALHNEWE